MLEDQDEMTMTSLHSFSSDADDEDVLTYKENTHHQTPDVLTNNDASLLDVTPTSLSVEQLLSELETGVTPDIRTVKANVKARILQQQQQDVKDISISHHLLDEELMSVPISEASWLTTVGITG